MMNIKNIILSVMFCLILLAGFSAAMITPDTEISVAERRRLAEKPWLTIEGVISGKYFTELDSYLTDSFVPREKLRALKAVTETRVFRKMEINGIYVINGIAVEMEYPLNRESVYGFTGKIQDIRDKLLSPDNRVFYSVIPDKNYFFAKESGRLSIDYDELLGILSSELKDMTYIDIFPSLTGADYYKTDSHWRQESLSGVTESLAKGLGFSENPFSEENEKRSYPFSGVYRGQTALAILPDTLKYLETPFTKAAEVSHIEDGKAVTVYDEKRLGGVDSYDVFLSGATAVCRISGGGEGELIIFRDSFASSLAPLLLSMYNEIVLVDTRYISPAVLPQYITFDNQDVLFLYSTGMINKSGALRPA